MILYLQSYYKQSIPKGGINMLKLFKPNRCYVNIKRNGKAPIHFGVPVILEPVMYLVVIMLGTVIKLTAPIIKKIRSSH